MWPTGSWIPGPNLVAVASPGLSVHSAADNAKERRWCFAEGHAGYTFVRQHLDKFRSKSFTCGVQGCFELIEYRNARVFCHCFRRVAHV